MKQILNNILLILRRFPSHKTARTMAVALLLVAVATLAMTGSPIMQDVRQREAKPEGGKGKAARDTMAIKAQPVIEGDDSIPDSLLHTRWPIQRTMPITLDDLSQAPPTSNARTI